MIDRLPTENRLRYALSSVNEGITEIVGSGNYYCTGETRRQFAIINNGIETIRLANSLRAHANDITSTRVTQKNQELTEVLHYIGNYLEEYKDVMRTRNVEIKQENELRELHQRALLNLTDIQESLYPHVIEVQQSLAKFSDNVGVTDRFTGYRNNLFSNRTPSVLQTNWRTTDTEQRLKYQPQSVFTGSNLQYRTMSAPPGQNLPLGRSVAWTGSLENSSLGNRLPNSRVVPGYRTNDSLYPRATTAPDVSASRSPNHSTLQSIRAINRANTAQPIIMCPTRTSKQLARSTPQEAAGIAIVFPAKTEYMTRYQYPNINSLKGGYTINPTPDMSRYSRPLVGVGFIPKTTEYTTRYEWPDGRRIEKFPWIRT